jgi:ketosteroid isomerase-like protein
MSEHLRLLERGYTMIWREDRVEEALRGLGEDFEWVVRSDHPEGAFRRGPDAVIQFFHEWIEPFADLQADWELYEAESDMVLAEVSLQGRGRESGAPVAMRFAQVWTFRGGRVVRMEMFNDIDEARRMAGRE